MNDHNCVNILEELYMKNSNHSSNLNQASYLCGSVKTYFTKLCGLIFVALLISSCGQANLTPLSTGATILAFGDSLTFGVGAKSDQSFPSVLSSLSGFEVINAGSSGETTSQGVKRFKSLLQTHQPELVILLEGGNDILRNHDLQLTKQNLATMIELAKAQQVSVILIGVPERKLFSDSAPL